MTGARQSTRYRSTGTGSRDPCTGNAEKVRRVGAAPSVCAALPAGELGLTLLDEGRDALEEVLAAAESVLELALEVELGVEVAVDEVVQRLLGARVGPGRARGQAGD